MAIIYFKNPSFLDRRLTAHFASEYNFPRVANLTALNMHVGSDVITIDGLANDYICKYLITPTE